MSGRLTGLYASAGWDEDDNLQQSFCYNNDLLDLDTARCLHYWSDSLLLVDILAEYQAGKRTV